MSPRRDGLALQRRSSVSLKPLLEAASEQTLKGLTDEWLAEPNGGINLIEHQMNYLNGRPFETLLTSAHDLARFGNMILNKGTLAGRQIRKQVHNRTPPPSQG